VRRHARSRTSGLAILAHLALAADARGQSLESSSATYVRYFDRALLPGPSGARVPTDHVVPVYEYLSLRARPTATPLGDPVEVEFSGWGNGLLADVGGEHRFDGDVTALNLRAVFGPAYAKLGRQIALSPAARFVRIDGASVGARQGPVRLDAYAGYVVLPRWSERPGQVALGSAADALVTSPLPEPSRSGSWAAGGRIEALGGRWGSLGASFHEAHRSSELWARDLAADARLHPWEPVDLQAVAIVDVGTQGLSEARTSVELRPLADAALTLDWRRADPTLLLPRDSVLAAFDTSRYDEVGADASYQPLERLSFGVSGYADAWTDGGTGARLSARMLATVDPARRLRVALTYGRTAESRNGYHAGRLSIAYLLAEPAEVVLEHQAYFYDVPIRAVATSSVDQASFAYRLAPWLRALLGCGITRSPYASLDAQALVRVVYEQGVLP
jgi:hypothetical protein